MYEEQEYTCTSCCHIKHISPMCCSYLYKFHNNRCKYFIYLYIISYNTNIPHIIYTLKLQQQLPFSLHYHASSFMFEKPEFYSIKLTFITSSVLQIVILIKGYILQSGLLCQYYLIFYCLSDFSYVYLKSSAVNIPLALLNIESLLAS